MAEKKVLSELTEKDLRLEGGKEVNKKNQQKKVERGGRLVPCFDPDDCGSNAICAR